MTEEPMTSKGNGERTRATWERYAGAWKAASREEKAVALRESVAVGCVYRDPLGIASGHDELIAYMLEFHKQVPGGHFETTYFQAHHGRSIARWNMCDGSGKVIGQGISHGEYDEAGHLIAMTGFFETTTPRTTP
jgi:hypothetical protein